MIRLYEDGAEYDLIHPSSEEARAFWTARALEAGGPALELACGSGSKLFPLAQAGLDVAGVDLSPAMLAQARRTLAALPPEVQARVALHQADMRNFDLGRNFRFAFLVANTPAHLLTRDDFAACMACVRRHLAPGGVFMLEIFVPNLDLLKFGPDDVQPYGEYDDPTGRGRVAVLYRARYDAATQVRHVRMEYHYPGQAEPVYGDLPMRIYFPAELDSLLHYNGFRIVAKYGDYALTPFSAQAGNQIFKLMAQ